jgi:hypothetical protein
MKEDDFNGWNIGKTYECISKSKICEILVQVRKFKKNYPEQFAEFITYRCKPWKALDMDEYTKEILEKHKLAIADREMWAVVLWKNL